MNVNDPKITLLRTQVKAAWQEFDMAVTFHEVWKPAAYDEGLHNRMGVSYATNAFHVVRMALRREMLLALMRLWDTDQRAVRMKSVAEALDDKNVINALATDRASRIKMAGIEDEMRQCLSQQANEAIALVNKYSAKGSHGKVLENLKFLRDKHLAHKEIAATGVSATDEEIESFYQDNSKLIQLLLSLVEAVAYDPEDAARVYRFHAKFFWAGVRGERTEGHPNFRAPNELPSSDSSRKSH